MNQTPFDIPCVILSGGKSSRMEEDKSLLPFSNTKSLIEFQYNRLKPFFKEVYISSKTNKFPFLDNKNLLLDNNEIYSPIIALNSIFNSIKDNEVFIITVDSPLVKIDSIKKIICEKTKEVNACIASIKNVYNLCGVFETSFCEKITNKMIKENIHKVGFLFNKITTKYIDFSDENEFINLNKKEDYYRAKLIIRETNNYH